MECNACDKETDKDKWLEIEVSTRDPAGFIERHIGGVHVYACHNCGTLKLNIDEVK